MGFPGSSVVKESACQCRTQVQSLGQEDPLSRKWQPTPIFLPGKFHEQRSYRLWSCKDSDRTEHPCCIQDAGYIYIYKYRTESLLYTWNIVNQLYKNRKKGWGGGDLYLHNILLTSIFQRVLVRKTPTVQRVGILNARTYGRKPYSRHITLEISQEQSMSTHHLPSYDGQRGEKGTWLQCQGSDSELEPCPPSNHLKASVSLCQQKSFLQV